MAKKLPYYPMDVDDFDNNEKVEAMTLAEVGLYTLALNSSWRYGYLPDDPELVAVRIKRKPADVRKVWKAVRDCYVPTCEPGKLVNPRQEEERTRALGKSEKAAGAAHTRWDRRLSKRNASAHADAHTSASAFASANAMPRAYGLLSSPSPSEGDARGNGGGVEAMREALGIASPAQLYERYHELLAVYPNPTEVDKGCQVWMQLVDCGEITAENIPAIVASVERWKASKQWAKGFKPSIANWVFGRRWLDNPEQITTDEGGW